MEVTATDLYAFGNRKEPRKPRPGIDVFPDAAGIIGPESPERARGASVFGDPFRALLVSHYHRLPAGTLLPEGFSVVADGVDVDSKNEHGPTHHTIYPSVAMRMDTFIEQFTNLPWEHAGKI